MKVEVCLADLKSEPIRLHGSADHKFQLESMALSTDWEEHNSKGSFQFVLVWSQ